MRAPIAALWATAFLLAACQPPAPIPPRACAGCLDESGACVDGMDLEACGSSGDACVACAPPQLCHSGRCLPTDPLGPPRALAFGTVALGDTATLSFVLNNPADSELTWTLGEIAPATAGEAAFSFLSEAGPGPLTVPAGGSRTVSLAFAPTQEKVYEATLSLSRPRVPPSRLRLTGTGVSTLLSWRTASVDFGHVPLGTEVTRELTFSNAGSEDILLTGIKTWLPAEFKVVPEGTAEVTKATVPKNGEYKMQLSFEPSILGPRNSTLSFATTLAKQPTGQVPLRGYGGGPAIQQVEPSPTLGFGKMAFFAAASAPAFQTRRLTVTNVGTRPTLPDPAANLHLGNAATPAYFTIAAMNADSNVSEIEIAQEPRSRHLPALEPRDRGRLELHLQLAGGPGGREGASAWRELPGAGPRLAAGPVPPGGVVATGSSLFYISSGTAPKKNVLLQASVAAGCLTIAPNDLDFGTVQVNCSSATRTFSIYNTCSTPVAIVRFAMQAAAGQRAGDPDCAGASPCPEFFLAGTPPIPSTVLSIVPGAPPVTFSAAYRPIDQSSDLGAIAIDAVQDGQRLTYLVTLQGRGDTQGLNTDAFTVGSNPRADVLLVIDPSSSVLDEQEALALNFDYFIQYAVAAQVDYHIGVTTADMDTREAQGRLIGDEMNPKVLTPTTANLKANFRTPMHSVLPRPPFAGRGC